MISPDSTDAESYESTLALLARVAPTLPPAARSRAAWNVATAKLDLKAALAAEGFDLHAPAVPAPKAAPVAHVTAPPPAASQRAQVATQPAAPVAVEKKRTTADDAGRLQLAAALMERAQLEGRATAATVAAFKQRAAAAAAETVENVNLAAREAMKKNPRLSFYEAVRENSGGTK